MLAYAGITLAANPPSRIIPWIYDPGVTNWRNIEICVYVLIAASNALCPSCGWHPCAFLPKNSYLIGKIANDLEPTPFSVLGWTIKAASTSLNTPASLIFTFPPKFSSPGVPTTRTVPPTSSTTLFKASPAAIPIPAIKLCPHPCPTSGNASYSHINAIVGPSLHDLYSATKSVSITTPAFTSKPASFKYFTKTFCVSYSWNPVSGLS